MFICPKYQFCNTETTKRAYFIIKYLQNDSRQTTSGHNNKIYEHKNDASWRKHYCQKAIQTKWSTLFHKKVNQKDSLLIY